MDKRLECKYSYGTSHFKVIYETIIKRRITQHTKAFDTEESMQKFLNNLPLNLYGSLVKEKVEVSTSIFKLS